MELLRSFEEFLQLQKSFAAAQKIRYDAQN
jgi:hypothetical protein